MKQFLLSEQVAPKVDRLRIGNFYGNEKCRVADAQSGLADFIELLRGSEDEARYVDLLLRAMSLIASYNTLIDGLNSKSDDILPRYVLEEEEFQE